MKKNLFAHSELYIANVLKSFHRREHATYTGTHARAQKEKGHSLLDITLLTSLETFH